MVLLVEVLGEDVVRHEWFFDFDEGLPLHEQLETWRDEREVPKGDTISPKGHRWYLMSPDWEANDTMVAGWTEDVSLQVKEAEPYDDTIIYV